MSTHLAILAPNLTRVTTPEHSLYFSYETLVAFSTERAGLIVRANEWGTTTGKHLSKIDGGTKEAKAERVNSNVWEINLRAFNI